MNIRDIMTVGPVTVEPRTTLSDAGRIMLDQHLSALPVTDRDGRLVGIMTDGDLLRRPELDTAPEINWWHGFFAPETSARQFVKTRGRYVGEIMTENVKTVTVETPLVDAVNLMEIHRIRQVPVVRGDALIGLLTRKNLLAALITRLLVVDDDVMSDDAKATMIHENITRLKWAPKGSVVITARDGIATLAGPIFSDAERRALIVLAENTKGVKSVVDRMIYVNPDNVDPSSGVAFGSF
ncbi:CBS domain-containing protein [Acidiphilium sp. AL]|nr:CBS domain-containing protein [Acidiphilium sp. AL]